MEDNLRNYVLAQLTVNRSRQRTMLADATPDDDLHVLRIQESELKRILRTIDEEDGAG